MERVNAVIESQAARFIAVALVASFASLQARSIYTTIRESRGKERLNRELQELYKNDALNASNKNASCASKDGKKESNETETANGIGNALKGAARVAASVVGGFDDELIREQLARNYAFFGEDGMDTIRRATITVVGCGGVGSWAAMMLARSGVAKLRLLDFDYVTLSSLNRHASATRAEVGTPKVQSLKNNIAAIAPWIDVETLVELWSAENEQEHRWLDGSDWVIDAIDNISTKVDLLSYCHSKGIKVIASMGAGAKMDPSHIQSADISQTIADPLARAVRRRLRMHPIHPVLSGIPVVYSTEVPPSDKTDGAKPLGLLPLPEEEFQKGAVHELAPFSDFRVRILPVLGMLPAIFGMHIATYLICELGGRKIEEPLAVKGRRKLWEKLAKDLTARETKWAGLEKQQRIPLTDEEVGFVFEELHRSKSSLPPFESLSRPTLVRWNFNEPLSVVNCVVMSPQEVAKHEEAYRNGQKPEDVWGPEVAAAVKRRRIEAQEWVRSVY